jgi:hypothetical protein
MTNEKRQTAVEWLIEKHFGGIENCTPDFRHKIEQAKEMEKIQKFHMFNCGRQYQLTGEGTFKQVYQEIYGGDEQ